MKQLLAAAIALAAGILLVPAPLQARAERPPSVVLLLATECPIEVPGSAEVECGTLAVPENYAEPGGSEVHLPYIILHSRNDNHAPDPLIYTAGGPGWSSLESVWGFVNSPILEERDVIVFEQRGNKYANPALICDASFAWQEVPGHTPCLDSIRAKGIDVAQYTTQNIVRDIIALRHALGYEQWNLYGTSFSTSLMLLVMEADPDGVRSAILESVKPPNETTFAHQADSGLRAIQQMFTDCAADAGCAAAYPELEARFYALVKELNQSPVEVEVRSTVEDELLPIEIDGDRFIDWIVLDRLYQPAFPPFGTAYLPLLISEASHGNLAPLKGAMQSFWSNTVENGQWAWGLLLAINCQQDMPAAGSARPAADIAAGEKLDGFSRSAGQQAACSAWDLPPLPPAATGYVQSDIPALVLAGAYDPVTPPAWSRATADHLPNSTYVEFAGHGHNLLISNPCVEQLQATFLDNPGKELDISCASETGGPSFVLPEAVYITPGLADSVNDVNLGGPGGTAWIETMSVVCLLGLLSLLVTLVIIGLLWLVRRREGGARLSRSVLVAYCLALLVIVGVLAMPVLVSRINNEYLGRNMFLYWLGPSRDFGPATLLAWLAPLLGLLILALAGISLWAWLAGRWTRRFRTVTTLVVLAALPMALLGLRWGLFTMLI
ncbi:MAG: alpha/beta hydrolase [Candidatus Promineifilaceae bacterium]